MRIDLQRPNGDRAFAEYVRFRVAGEDKGYELEEIYGYNGNAGDIRGSGNSGDPTNARFSTYDRDNDKSTGNCAALFKGGWWHKDCFDVCLTCDPIRYDIWNGDLPTTVSMKIKIDKSEERLERDHKGALDQSLPVVIDPEQGVALQCQPRTMRLTFEPSVLLGLALDDLEPLKNDCVGFSKAEEDGKYVYIIPLSDCGAQVKVHGDQIAFTNSLVYAKNMTSQVKYFSDVILTHSCSYPMSAYNNAIKYTVYSNNYTFDAENEKPAAFDVSLNVFGDNTFTDLINNGGTVNIAEGRHLFGDIDVTSSDPNLRVALGDCHVSMTNTPGDKTNTQLVIQSGCQTAYGARVLSSSRFSMLTRSFAKNSGQKVYLHCSVVVCGLDDMLRCTRNCAQRHGGDAVIGKRSNTEILEDSIYVTAGPFLIQ